MKTNELPIAEKIRRIYKQKVAAEKRHRKAFYAAKQECEHETHIIFCSYYSGSYSHDMDDWHSEIRLCLKCGYNEHRDKSVAFDKLTTPKARFELYQYLGKDSDPFRQDKLLTTPYEELVKFAMTKGYPIRG